MQTNQPTPLPSGQDVPASSLKKIMQPQNVQKQIPNTSHLDGMPGAVNSGVSSIAKHQKASKYGIAPISPLRIVLCAILSAPFALWGEIWAINNLDSTPEIVMTVATIRALIVISAMLVTEIFMAGAFRLKLGNINRKGANPATQSPAKCAQAATENVAEQGA